MKEKIAFQLLIAGVLSMTPPITFAGENFHSIDTNAVLGGAIGGGAGAAVGSAIGGRNGALVGSAVGAVAGVAIATPTETKVIHEHHYYEHDHRRHRGHFKHYKPHRDNI